MATSIFFTESKDFKLIRDQILNLGDDYLVYVYADTTNLKIPRELIMQLPRYGNNLIWVDTTAMDSSDLSHHIVLTIGQLVNPEEEIDFFIVSKSSKLEKTIIFLRNQGIPAELIAPATDKPKAAKAKGTGKPGRPKKAVTVESTVVVAEPKKKGRPKTAKATAEPAAETALAPVVAEPKKRGRKPAVKAEVEEAAIAVKKVKKVKNVKNVEEVKEVEDVKKEKKEKKEKKVKKEKKEKKEKKVKKGEEEGEVKPRKQRVDKEITEGMVQEKLSGYTTTDSNVASVMSELFGMKKVARPKFFGKLVDRVKNITLEDDTVAENIIGQLKELNILEISEPGGRIYYKD